MKQNPIKTNNKGSNLKRKEKRPLKIYDVSFNLIRSEEDQISKITEFFVDLFSSDETQISVMPKKIESPFTPEEIQIALQKFKNNKVTWLDGVHAEYLKYGSNQLIVNISDILNKAREIGEYPEDVRLGTLNPQANHRKRMKK